MVQGPKSRYICLGGWEQVMPASQLVAPILRLSGSHDGITQRMKCNFLHLERKKILWISGSHDGISQHRKCNLIYLERKKILWISGGHDGILNLIFN
jgi:hypothetical protein